MGAAQTRAEFIDNIFKMNRLNPNKDRLVLRNLLSYQKYMRRDYNFEFNHLASLYFIDKKKQGYFVRDDLLEFMGMFVQFKIKNEFDYLRKFQAYATTEFWKDLKDVSGKAKVTEWMITLFKESSGTKTFEGSKEEYFTSTNINEMYQLLRVEDFSGSTFEEFMRLFQKVAEDSGQTELSNPEYDDVVPTSVVYDFLKQFLEECYCYLQNILETTSTQI